ncbi:hypothetical protein [Brevundimonas sp.]|uniref:hypothetical protein n=2 Tax=Brevundimonas sp. TaxID=1871086 RepID=UPI00403414D8
MTGSTTEQQEPQPTSPAAQQGSVVDLGEIEVVSERLLRERVQSFTREATAPPPGRPLARWDRRVCVGVSNLDGRYARFMIDRVVMLANDLGLETGEPGCRPNIIIAAAADANELARGLVKDDAFSFRPAQSGASLGEAALARFQSTDAPVRWWHVSLPVTMDGGDIALGLLGDFEFGPEGPQPLSVRVREVSRLRANTREDLQRATIIINTERVGFVGFGALSDYVAMVALAQMAPEADTSAYDTVLNLFRPGANRSAGLTQWDRDYLKALYSARRDYARPTQQVRAIVSEVIAQHDQRPQ